MPLRRVDDGPFLVPADVPALRRDLVDVTSVFNPGAVRWRGRELLLLRVQTRGRTTVLLPAEVVDDTVEFLGPPVDTSIPEPVPAHVYDPRLSVVDDRIVAVCAADTDDGCALVTLTSDDFEHWDLVGLDASDDHRNGVLFPDRIDGRFLRLERPNRVRHDGGPLSGATITCSASDDLVTWERVADVVHGRPRRWDEILGSGPPPVRTRAGWLHLVHGVATHFGAANVYQAGVMLLDPDEPWKVIARGAFNVLEPRTSWELTGQVPNVVFPSGMTVDLDDEGFAAHDAVATIYYGAADTVVGRATATIGELIEDARFHDPAMD